MIRGLAKGGSIGAGDQSIWGLVAECGGVDILVSSAGIQSVHPIEEFRFAEWKKVLAIHLDGAFPTTKARQPYMYRSGRGGSILYEFGIFQGGLTPQGPLHDCPATPGMCALRQAKLTVFPCPLAGNPDLSSVRGGS